LFVAEKYCGCPSLLQAVVDIRKSFTVYDAQNRCHIKEGKG